MKLLPQHRKGTFQFFGTDNVNRSTWKGLPIEYILNEQGYRCPEWNTIDWCNSIIVFGASNVFGVGVSESETVSNFIKESTGINTINLGLVGSSCSAQWINSMLLIDNSIAPKSVVYIWPDESRDIEFKDDTNPIVEYIGHWSKTSLSKEWCKNQHQAKVLADYYSLAVKTIWNCPVIEYRLPASDSSSPLIQLDDSRDRLHPGPVTFKAWADVIVKDLKCNY